jgi:hypothetical protein
LFLWAFDTSISRINSVSTLSNVFKLTLPDLQFDIRLPPMTLGSDLAILGGYPFEVRYSKGSSERARVMADLTADAYVYFGRLFSSVQPDIAIIVANRSDWESRQPYGLPFFNDDEGQIRPGIVVMPSGRGEFWVAMGEDLHDASPMGYSRLLTTYPDGTGGLDLQPFFDLVVIHELGHAFEVFGDLRLPTFWLGEIFANLALHTFVATKRPEDMATLESLAIVGTESPRLDARIRAEGYSTLEELETHYTGGGDPMSPLNYVWYQYRWLRLAAAMYEASGEDALVRLWGYFRSIGGTVHGDKTTDALARLLNTEVSETLGRAVMSWR